jgi:hypothetical protein
MSLEDEIDLNLCELPSNLGARGRQPANVTSEFVRELTVADLNAPIVKTQTAPAIKDIKDRHHALARVLATGESEGNASAITGYSQSRISILKADPQFQELLAFYRGTAIDEVEAYRKRMVMVGQSALNELADRLEEKPETFTPGTLKDIAKDLADRVGLAPNGGGSKSVNVNISLRDAMADARARVEAHRQSKVIDHE